jgi:hypothetical protein
VNSEPDVAADLGTRGCAVCNHVIRAARDFFAQWQYALTCDERAQSAFAEELGFCPIHTWQLHAMSSPWGESIGLAPLAEHVSGILAKADRDQDAEANIKNVLLASKICRVCGMLDEVKTTYMERLRDLLIDLDGKQLYERSQGVCLRHLRELLSITSEELGRFLWLRHPADSQKLPGTCRVMQSSARQIDVI